MIGVPKFLFRAIGICLLSARLASAETVTISLNFAADEPPGPGSEIESGEPAGLLGTTEWNNLGLGGGGTLTSEIAENLIDSNGNQTTASVFWEANNTWASAGVETSPGVFEGRGEVNILDSVPGNGDRKLMTGYIDSNAVDRFCTEDESQLIGNWCGANRVTVGGLPYGDEPYDVILYFNGGVLDRGGFVKLNDQDPVVQHDTKPFDGTFDLSFEERDINGELYTVYTGDVIIFTDVTGDSFTINTHGFNLGNGTFRSFINGIEISGDVGGVGPLCDFDANGVCDIADLDELLYVGLGGTDSKYDLNGSGGVIDLADRDAFLTMINTVPGDFNLDGQVVASDLNALGGNWQKTGITTYAAGDTNGDGNVNAADLNALGSNWQFGAAAAATVPEPSSGMLLLMALVLGVLCRRQC